MLLLNDKNGTENGLGCVVTMHFKSELVAAA